MLVISSFGIRREGKRINDILGIKENEMNTIYCEYMCFSKTNEKKVWRDQIVGSWEDITIKGCVFGVPFIFSWHYYIKN